MECSQMLLELRSATSTEEKAKALDDVVAVLTDPKNEESTDDLSSDLVEQGLLDDLLSMMSDNTDVLKVTQVLAEVAKTESVREPCVEKGFVPLLMKFLDKDNDVQLSIQSCRALGNICFDNDLGRNAVDESNGITSLLSLLRSHLKSSEDGADKLRTIACGFLLNLTNTHEALQEKAINEGALDVIEQYLHNCPAEDSGLCNMVLITIASITDTEHCKEKLLSSTLCKSLVDFLASPNSELHVDTVLDILTNLSEWDEIKDLLAETDLSNHLIQVIQSNTGKMDEESSQKVKMASDLLILMLTGEKSMELMFAGGDGPIFVESIKWLEGDDGHLHLSGALAVGNFARSDAHCQMLVKDGIVDRLLELLKRYREPETSNITLQHAILSALRNLAIPVPNKEPMLKAGVLEAVLELLDTEILAVTFKLLGVLRMLIDGKEEASITLGTNKEFLPRLVEWCGVDEHPGVRGEATRLLAWLIKHSRSEEVMKSVIRADGIPHLVAMTTSEHVVMQNEALVALTLTGATVLGDAAIPLRDADLIGTIVTLLKDDSTLPEILCNTLTLTKTICSADNLKEELVASGIADIVKELTNHEDSKVIAEAKTVENCIEEMRIER